MVMVRNILLVWCSSIYMGCGVSAIFAIDAVHKKNTSTVKTQANKNKSDSKKQQEKPKDLLKDIAQKMYTTKFPTRTDLEELDELITGKEGLINKKPYCKRELELNRQDFEARMHSAERRKKALDHSLKETMAQKAVMNSWQQQGKNVAAVPLDGPGIHALRDQIGTQQVSGLQQQPTQETKSEKSSQGQKQITKPEKQRFSGFTEEQIRSALQMQEEEEDEGTAITTLPQVSGPLPSQEETVTSDIPSAETLEVAPEESKTPPVALVTSHNLPLALIEPFAQHIVKPLEQSVTTMAQKVAADEVVTQIPLTLALYSPAQQKKSMELAASVITQAHDIGVTPTIVQTVQPLVEQLSTAIVPIKNYTQLMHATGIVTRQKEGIKLSDLSYSMYEAGRDAKLEKEEYVVLVDSLRNVVQELMDRAALASPTITAALVLALSDEKTEEREKLQQNLAVQFGYWLQSFDALLYGGDLRAYIGDNPLSKEKDKFTFNLWKKGRERVIKELTRLHLLLGTIGPVLIEAIEAFIREYGSVMNQEIVDKWYQGKMGIPEYINDTSFTKHRREYTTVLVKKLKELEDTIQKELDGITNTNEQQRVKSQLTQQRKIYNEGLKKIKVAQKTAREETVSTQMKQQSTGEGILLPPTLQRTGKKLVPSTPPIPPVTKEVSSLPASTSMQSKSEKESGGEMALVPARQSTAHPVVNKEFEDIINAVNNLNSTTGSIEKAWQLHERIGRVNVQDLLPDQEKRYKKAQVDFSTKFSAIQNKQQRKDELEAVIDTIRDLITHQKLINADRLGGMYTRMLAARGVLSTEEKKAYDNKLAQLLTQYAQETLIAKMKENSEDLFALQVPILLQSVDTLARIKTHIPTLSVAQSVRDIMVKLCALYDYALYLVYHPTELMTLISTTTSAEGTEEGDANENSLEYYLGQVRAMRALFTELNEEDEPVVGFAELIVRLSNFLPADEAEKVRAGSWDISIIDRALVENAVYKYFVAQDTPVTIAGKPCNTLTQLDAMHAKKYDAILKEWYYRVSFNETIEQLQQGIDIQKISAEERQKMQNQLQDIADKVPTLFKQDATLRDTLEKLDTVINAATAQELLTLDSADLLAEIEKAQKLYTDKRIITGVKFAPRYEALRQAGGATFNDDIQKIDAALSNYVTTIIKTEYAAVAGFPARGYEGSIDLRTSIDDIRISSDVTDMLTQLHTLGLFTMIDQEANPYRKLYWIILQTYGYILATFDAITAKLFDGAQNPKTWTEFFGIASSKTQYENAESLIDELLKPIAKLRSFYYEKCIEPYFQETAEIKKYTQGNLSLLDLELEYISRPDHTYIYAREGKQLKVYGGVALTLNSVIDSHMVFKDLVTGIIHGGNLQYQMIIKNWEKIINTELHTEYILFIKKQVNNALDSILNVSYGPLLQESLDEPTFGTLYDRYTDENIPNPYTSLNYLLEDNEYAQAEALYYLDFFFATVAHRLDNKKLLRYLGILTQEDALPSDMRQKIKDIFGESFALLDSIIAWVYQNIKDHLNDSARKKVVGDVLARYYNPILAIFTALKKYVPYLDTSDSDQFTVSTYVRSTTQQPEGLAVKVASLPIYPFTVREPVSSLALIPFSGTYKPKPLYIAGIPFLQTGVHSLESIESSIKSLKRIMEYLGGSPTDSAMIKVVQLLDSFVELFYKQTFPSKEDIQEFAEGSQQLFNGTKLLLKKVPENKKIIDRIAILPIMAYRRLLASKQEIAGEHKQVFIDLIHNFYTAFRAYFDLEIEGFLHNIIAWKPLGTSVQKLLPATTVVVPEQVLTQADKTREYTAISKLSGILKQEGMNEEKFKQVEKRLIDAFEGEGARKAQGLPRTLTPTALDDIAQQLTAAYKATTNPIIIAIIRKLYDLFNAELSEEMQKKLRSIIEQRAQPSEQKIEEVAVGTPGAVTAESAMASSGEKQESKNIPQKRAATTPSRKAKAKTPSPGKKKQKPSVTKPPQSSTTKKEELQYLPDVVKQNL